MEFPTTNTLASYDPSQDESTPVRNFKSLSDSDCNHFDYYSAVSTIDAIRKLLRVTSHTSSTEQVQPLSYTNMSVETVKLADEALQAILKGLTLKYDISTQKNTAS